MTILYAPVEEQECWKCSTSPVVGICGRWGLTSTGLCGACFFSDKTMVDPEAWNDPKEDTE